MTRVKFPRTPHVPWSQSSTPDDLKNNNLKKLDPDSHGLQKWTASLKLDGECTAMYSDGYCHARSIDSPGHSVRSYVRALAASVAHLIPKNTIIYGENLWAAHSIKYENLLNYFYIFAIVQDQEVLSVENTIDLASELGIPVAPIIYSGPLNYVAIDRVFKDLKTEDEQEGYVIRPSSSFPISDWGDLVTKWVRPHHVQTPEHWLSQPIIQNGLKHA